MDASLSLWGLFISAFLSSTLLPGGSEAVLLALAATESAPRSELLIVASIGNTLGGMTSWGIGRLLAWRYPAQALSKHDHQRALQRVQRYGAPILLLSWLPIIGDPLCVAAGWLKINPLLSAVCIGAGKAARYAVLLWFI